MYVDWSCDQFDRASDVLARALVLATICNSGEAVEYCEWAAKKYKGAFMKQGCVIALLTVCFADWAGQPRYLEAPVPDAQAAPAATSVQIYMPLASAMKCL